MVIKILLLLIVPIFLLNGYQLGEKIEKEAKQVYKKAKKKYAKYRGEKEQNEPRPFDVVYQKDQSRKIPIIISNCNANQDIDYTCFATPTDAGNRFILSTNTLVSRPGGVLKPFWDVRYVNPVNCYIAKGDYTYCADLSIYTGLDAHSGNKNLAIGTGTTQTVPSGDVAQSLCANGILAGGANINLYDAPSQEIYYAGLRHTLPTVLTLHPILLHRKKQMEQEI